jgi:hypothetical protein
LTFERRHERGGPVAGAGLGPAGGHVRAGSSGAQSPPEKRSFSGG